LPVAQSQNGGFGQAYFAVAVYVARADAAESLHFAAI